MCMAQVIYNYSIVNLIKSYPYDTLTACSCYLCGTLYTVHCQNYTCMRQVKKMWSKRKDLKSMHEKYCIWLKLNEGNKMN